MTEPIFKIINGANHCKIYANGMTEGFPTNNGCIVNNFPIFYTILMAKLIDHLPFETVRHVFCDVLKPYFPEKGKNNPLT